jgi:hypothetical protein
VVVYACRWRLRLLRPLDVMLLHSSVVCVRDVMAAHGRYCARRAAGACDVVMFFRGLLRGRTKPGMLWHKVGRCQLHC